MNAGKSADSRVHARHQGLRSAAVGQGHGLGLQPDDVAREGGHLIRQERDARAQLVCMGETHFT